MISIDNYYNIICGKHIYLVCFFNCYLIYSLSYYSCIIAVNSTTVICHLCVLIWLLDIITCHLTRLKTEPKQTVLMWHPF